MTSALSYGAGAKCLDAFLEPTCPFSARAFERFEPLIEKVGADRLTVRIWLHSQPWHLSSGIVTRAILAAAEADPDGPGARRIMAAVFANREAFEFDDHCRGPNMEATPRDILKRLQDLSGVDVSGPFDEADLQVAIKRHTKFARQNGIHVSPTFMVDGLIEPRMSSGDPVESWIDVLGLG